METENSTSSPDVLSSSILETEIKIIISDLKELTENEIINTGYIQRIKDNLLSKIVSNISKENFAKSIEQLQEEAFVDISNRFYEIAVKSHLEEVTNQNRKSAYETRLLEGMEFQEIGLDTMANFTFLKVYNIFKGRKQFKFTF